MTTEILLETIADLEAKVNELEYQLENAEDELAMLRDELNDEMQVSRDYKELLLDIKLQIINSF
jgi:predicted RNase H-like nuclease (RuvC/YqgF family)